MALSVSTVWEIRTTGGVDHGGGFAGSTANTLAFTDLDCDDSTTCTSDAAGFTAAMEGAVITIAAGDEHWVAGDYVIANYVAADEVELATMPVEEGEHGENGTGHVHGSTDYSQQNDPQVSRSNFTADTVTLTSATADTFTHAMIGNLIYLSAGTHVTTGFYEIKTYIDDHSVTLDRDPATGGVIDHGDCVGQVGGAQSRPVLVCAAIPAASAVGANRVWIKAGEYVVASTVTVTGAGTKITPHVITGYNTTRGDATAPCVTWNADNGNFDVYTSGAAYIWLEYITATNRVGSATTRTTNGFNTYTGSHVGALFYRCRATNVGDRGFYAGIYTSIIGCESDNFGVTNNSSYPAGFDLHDRYGALTVGCYAHDGNGYGFIYGSDSYFCKSCIADTCTGVTGDFGTGFYIYSTSQITMIDSIVVYNCKNGVKLGNASSNYLVLLIDCILANNTTGIASAAGKGIVKLLGCAFYHNTNEIDTNTTVIETIPRISLGQDHGNDPFTDAAAGDFSLDSSVTEIIGTGWPGQFLSGGALTTWHGHPDYGAVQTEDVAGGGSGGGLPILGCSVVS